jgi:hypothetical protein
VYYTQYIEKTPIKNNMLTLITTIIITAGDFVTRTKIQKNLIFARRFSLILVAVEPTT